MNYLLAYSGLTTKVRAMEHNLLKSEDYEQIMNLSSVAELVGYLQNHPAYQDIFDGIETTDLHRGSLEQLLYLSKYQSFAKLYNFASVKSRRYLQMYFVRYETRLLKQMIRELLDENHISIDVKPLTPYFERFSDLNVTRLTTATSMDEFIDALSGTKFQSSVRQVSALTGATLFDYEIALDLYHFTTLWKCKNKYLKGKDLETVTTIYGTTIDLLNLQWIYRTKKYYKVSNSAIFALIIPINYKLRPARIKQLVEQDSVGTLEEFLLETPYKKFAVQEDTLTLESIYRIMQNMIHHRLMQKHPYSLAAVTHYLYNKHIEVSTLITLTECIRYGYTPAEIKKILHGGDTID